MSEIPKEIAYCSILLIISTVVYTINNVSLPLFSILHFVGMSVKWNGQKAVSQVFVVTEPEEGKRSCVDHLGFILAIQNWALYFLRASDFSSSKQYYKIVGGAITLWPDVSVKQCILKTTCPRRLTASYIHLEKKVFIKSWLLL